MISSTRVRQLLPLVVSAIIVVFAGRALWRTLSHIALGDMLAAFHQIPLFSVISAGLLVLAVYGALATYEAIVVRHIKADVHGFVAVVAGLAAAPIGHAMGWGALSGGAVRYRMYSNAGLRPLQIAKIAALAAMPYAAGLGFVLGLALVLQADRAALLLRVEPSLARGAGLALLALHAAYFTLVSTLKKPLQLGSLSVTLPPPSLTLIQYVIGSIEVFAGSGVLYALLPDSANAPPYVVFVAVYVLCILAGLASSVPAGLGVFDGVLLFLLPQMPKASLVASVLVYRFLLEAVPLILALVLFALFELKTRRDRAEPDSDVKSVNDSSSP